MLQGLVKVFDEVARARQVMLQGSSPIGMRSLAEQNALRWADKAGEGALEGLCLCGGAVAKMSFRHNAAGPGRTLRRLPPRLQPGKQ